MFDHHLVERLIVAVGDECLRGLLVEAADFLEQAEEGAAAVGEMVKPVFLFRGAEGMHVEADVFSSAAVAIAFERADLVERAAKVGAAERTVLVILEAVLIVQVERPEFPEGAGEINFVRRVRPASVACALSMRHPTRFGSRVSCAMARAWPMVGM